MIYYESYNQPWIFLYTFCGGVVLGLVYDLFRMARRTLNAGWLLTALLDILYALIGGVVLAITFFTAAQGELRFYMFAGAALGMTAYLFGLSRLVMGSFHFLRKQIRRLLTFLKDTKTGKWLSK